MTTEHTQTLPSSQATGAPQVQEPTKQEPSNFSIPEAYREKPWAEKIKSPDDVWKTLDNAQTLIGKRPAGIPSPDASDAEWEAFNKAVGHPAKPEEYKFRDIEGLPEGVDLTPVKQEVADVLHQAGVPQKYADKIFAEYVKRSLDGESKRKAESEAKQKQLDVEFDKLSKELFGDKYDDMQKSTIEAFNKYAPQSLKGGVNAITDNPQVLALTTATIGGLQNEINQLKQEYGAEGSLNTSRQQVPGNDINAVRSELATLRLSQSARDFLSPQHKVTTDRINELEAIVKRHYDKK